MKSSKKQQWTTDQNQNGQEKTKTSNERHEKSKWKHGNAVDTICILHVSNTFVYDN